MARRRLGVRGSLLLAFIGIAGLVVVASVAGIYALIRVNQAIDAIVEQRVPGATLSLKLAREAERVLASARPLAGAEDDAGREAQWRQIETQLGRIAELERHLQMIGEPIKDEPQVLARLTSNLEELNKLTSERLKAAESKAGTLQRLLTLLQVFEQQLRPPLRLLEAEVAQFSAAAPDKPANAMVPSGAITELVGRIPAKSIEALIVGLDMRLLVAAHVPLHADLKILGIEIRRLSEKFDRDLAGLSPDLREILGSHRDELNEIVSGPEGIITLRERELHLQDDSRALLTENQTISEQLSAILDAKVSASEHGIEVSTAGAASVRRTSIIMLGLVTAASLLTAALLVLLYVDRQIIARLDNFSTAMLALAAGRLDIALPPPGQDEIGRLGGALEIFQSTAIKAQAREIALQRAAVTLTALGEAGQQIISNLDAEAVFAALERHVGAILNQPALSIHLIVPPGDLLVCRFGWRPGGGGEARDIALTDPASDIARAAREHREILVETLPPESGAGRARDGAFRLHGPLIAGERLIGVLTIESLDEVAFGERERSIFRTFCSYAAIALDNANAYRELGDALVELKHAQAELVQQEKLASLGQMVAGIAHEIQNPLNFVINFSEMSSDLMAELADLPPDADDADRADLTATVQKNLGAIAGHGRRAAEIVRSMLRHSRGGTGVVVPTDVNHLLQSSVSAAVATSPVREQAVGIEILWDLAPELPNVRLVQQDVAVVIDNLLRNAIYAVDARRRAAKAEDAAWRPLVTVRSRQKDDRVEISVRDTGSGIPEAVRAKLFLPFFTTKPAGDGTGLGLSLSFDIIVKRHRGQFDITSVVGDHTLVTIGLPIAGPVA